MPDTAPRRAATSGFLLDFRPVLRNRRAMAWIVGYTVHTWELAALRAWAVTFLTVTMARLGSLTWLPSPAAIFTLAGLAGVAISVTGNETAQRYGRNRVVLGAMLTAAALSLGTGWTTSVSVALAIAAVFLWNMAIYFDSSALTAGTVQAADPHLRGATMGLHSMSGYGGGFIGPLGVGFILDLSGGNSVTGWGLAFGHIAVIALMGLFILRKLGRIETVSASEATRWQPPDRAN
jgi:MFS family permease